MIFLNDKSSTLGDKDAVLFVGPMLPHTNLMSLFFLLNFVTAFLAIFAD